MNTASLHVLMLTSEWPVSGSTQTSHFIKRQAEFLREAGVDLDVFHFRGRKNPLNYVRAWTAVRRKLRHRRYDLIHAQFGQSGILALPKRIPLLVTLRGSDVFGIVGSADGRYTCSGRVLTRISRWVASRADAVVLVSEHMKSFVPDGRLVRVIPSGIDLELFRPIPRAEARQRLGWPQDERVVLFAGQPSLPRKRCNLAQESVEIVNRALPTRFIAAWGVPHHDMPVYMNACDVLVLTSIHEGSPNVVKEALACNVPVVSVNVGDVADRLAGIDGCYVCPDELPVTIAACLERVLRRNERVKGREAIGHLDERNLTQQVIGVYQAIVA